MHESAFGRVLGVLIAPEKTFRSIAERPTWAVPLILLVVLGAGVGWIVGQRMDFEQTIRQEMADRGEKMSDDQIQKTVEMTEKFGWVFTTAPAALSPVIYLLIGLIFMVALRLAGSEIGFAQSFSVTLYAMMPWVIHGLLSLPLILRLDTIDPATMQQGGVLTSNLAALAPEGSGKVLMALLASIDLFSLWTLVLLIIGFRVVGRVSTTAAAGVSITLWLLYLAGKLGFAAAFS
jgi:hypothetical protein